MTKSDEHSVPDRRARVETLPYTLIASAACKIRRGCNVLQVTIQIIPLGVPKGGAIPSVVDQNCDDMSPDHSHG